MSSPTWIHENVKNEIEIPHPSTGPDEAELGCNPTEAGFVRAMSHELRTPLNVIIGSCQILERDQKRPLTPSQRDTVDRMQRNARALLQSINHLITCLRTGRFE
jgi:K+-sensing histidine kinase KdpD